MSEKTIMLVCAAGMSTSLLVTKMQRAAKDQNIDAKIFATSTAEADSKIENDHPDVLLLGPQVSYMLDDFKKRVAIPVAVINMQDYGMMDGPKVLDQALGLIK